MTVDHDHRQGGLYTWEFEKGARELKVRVEGQLVFNDTFQMLNAALGAFGLGYVPGDPGAATYCQWSSQAGAEGLVPSGYHLYHSSRRQSSATFSLLIDALRHRG